MIAAQDLRVGNIVQNKVGIPFKVSLEDFYDLYIMDSGITEDYFYPLELSPDILEAAGFEKRLINKSFYEYYLECTPPKYKKAARYKFTYWDVDGYCRMQWKPFLSGTIHEFPCKYLHQLQNLYYFLCGEELTINLKTSV